MANKYKNKKIIIDDILFDSKIEGEYYQHLKKLKEKGEIKDFEIKPKFVLQEKFQKQNKTIRKIEYIADYLVFKNDGSKQVIDIKGFETADFKIKKKMFDYKFRDIELLLLTYVKKRGGWITLEENKRLKKLEKKGVK